MNDEKCGSCKYCSVNDEGGSDYCRWHFMNTDLESIACEDWKSRKDKTAIEWWVHLEQKQRAEE